MNPVRDRTCSIASPLLFLRGLFPQRAKESAWITLIWSVYPGFFSQSVSIAYVQHFLTYALFNFSLAGMVWSIRLPKFRKQLTILSILSSFMSLFTMEYFLGLEALRPIILMFLVSDKDKKFWLNLKKVLYQWIPYLVVVGIFVVYRFWIMNILNQGVSANQPVFLLEIIKDPINTIILLLQMSIQDIYYMVFYTFTNTLPPTDILLTSRIFLFSLFLGLVISILFMNFIKNWESFNHSDSDSFQRKARILSIAAMGFGGIPVWGMKRQVIIGLWSDRFSLAPMFGVSILVVVLIYWISKKEFPRNAILIFIVTMSIAYQIRIVNDFSYNWVEQKRFYWQLLWRIPSLEPGTAVLSPTIPFGSVAEYSINYAI